MNTTFPVEQISKTGNRVSDLITRQFKLHLMARFMELKSVNPRLRQDQRAKEIGCSTSTLQRYRNDINMLSPCRIPPNSNRRKQKSSNHERDPEKPRLTSFDFKTTQTTAKESSPEVKPVEGKHKLKSGANIETNGDKLDEALHINDF